ncbi:cytochrome P450 [Streptomyces sp. SAI-135]|uniref:cytochrome P450 n=2 Tax=unclassified Streptomyces TaxID=2593676 RepID=UPI0024730264|nr:MULTISPECIES: cytochrome P450 [unclassified Streptomyces]MDH6522936.1 cytochrome P450 [Streptomyces sp. SAI-090]MDH6613450.1 cytochrome P450 [Streptomyces sp. SAI-135]
MDKTVEHSGFCPSWGPLPDFLDPPPLPDDVKMQWAKAPSGVGMWVVSDYHLARQILSDKRFSRSLAAGPEGAKIGITDPSPESIISMDGEEHAALRRLVAGTFTHARIAELQPFVETLVTELLDDVASRGPQGDLVSGLAVPLPIHVICHVMGIPLEDRNYFAGHVAVLFDLTGAPGDGEDHTLSLIRYMMGLIARKRREKKRGTDLISVLIEACDDDGKLTNRAMVTLCLAILMAGYETTVDQISLTILDLLSQPGKTDALRNKPSLIPDFVEDALRTNPAVTTTFARMATESVEMDGLTIQPGEAVIVDVLGANYGLSEVETQKSFRPMHLTFGHGVHRCLGSHLAKIQLTEAVRGVLTRLPPVSLAEDMHALDWKTGHATRGLNRLLVSW